MTKTRAELRQFTRVALDLPVDVHQGGSMWPQELIDISLSGVATTQPDLWDAQYNEPFTLIIHTSGERGDEGSGAQHHHTGRAAVARNAAPRFALPALRRHRLAAFIELAIVAAAP